MQIRINPLGKMVNDFLMKWALPLGLFFIVEYWVSTAVIGNTLLTLLAVPMSLVTPVALWWILRKLRRTVLNDMMLGIQAWSFGVQLMFFAGLIEALFIFIYNRYINPEFLYSMKLTLASKFEQLALLLTQMNPQAALDPSVQEAINEMKDAPVPSAIEAAISTLSSDIFMAMFLMIPIAFIVRRKPH